MSDEAPKPVLLMTGNLTLAPLFVPLAEHFRLAFADDAFAKAAEGFDVKDVLSLADFSGDTAVLDAKGQAMLAAADLVEEVGNGKLTLGTATKLHGQALLRWLPVSAFEMLSMSIARISACSVLQKKEGIAGVLVHEDVTPNGRVLAQFGNAMGIPTMHLPHANHFLRPGSGDIHCTAVAEHLGVTGPYMRDWYSACGVMDDRMTTVGMPRWDKLYDEERLPSKAQARNAFGIKDGERVLGYGTTWFQVTSVWGDNPEAYLTESLHTVIAAAKETGAFLLLSMHPGELEEQVNFYAQEIRGAGIRGAVARAHPEHTLRAMDCLVSQGPSNFGIEANILGTPVVELFVPGARYPDGGPEGTWGKDLVSTIDRATVHPGFATAMNAGASSIERTVEWVRATCSL